MKKQLLVNAKIVNEGHVFEGEGYAVPTDQRWCINSVALVLEERQ